MKLRILVADDTRFMRAIMKEILQSHQHEIVGEADNGREAVRLYKELKPELILLDISMPEMDGITALKMIREADPDAIVIICSGISQQDLISEALEHGAKGYIMKPFQPEQVNDAIQKYAIPHLNKRFADVQAVHTEQKPANNIVSIDQIKPRHQQKMNAVEQYERHIEPFKPREKAVGESVIPSDLLNALEEPVERTDDRIEELAERINDAEIKPLETLIQELVPEINLNPVPELELQPQTELESQLELESNFALDPVLESQQPELTLPPTLTEEELEALYDHTDIDEIDSEIESLNLSPGESYGLRGFVTDYHCNWQEVFDGGQKVDFTVNYREGDSYLSIEMHQESSRRSLRMSVDGFMQLAEWLRPKLPRQRMEQP